MPEIEHTNDDPHALVDVEGDHINTVPSDFRSRSSQTETQEKREELQEEARERAEEAREKAEQAKKVAARKSKEAEGKAKQFLGQAKENSNNPVVIGNVVVMGALAAVFGTRVYQRWQREGFSWEFAGITAGFVAAFGVADYFISRYVVDVDFTHNDM